LRRNLNCIQNRSLIGLPNAVSSEEREVKLGELAQKRARQDAGSGRGTRQKKAKLTHNEHTQMINIAMYASLSSFCQSLSRH